MTIVDEILIHLILQFRDQGFLCFEMGKKLVNHLTSDFIPEYSFVQIDDLGMIYYNPFRREFFYDGAIDLLGFDIIEHMLLKLSFRSLLPWRLEAVLKNVFETKTPKRVLYTEQAEADLFMI